MVPGTRAATAPPSKGGKVETPGTIPDPGTETEEQEGGGETEGGDEGGEDE
jgi:hypothetical protein